MAVSPTGKALRNKELRDLFNKIWSENISSVLPPTLPTIDGPDIDIKLEKIFLEHFKQHPNIVNIIRYMIQRKHFPSIILNMLWPLKSLWTLFRSMWKTSERRQQFKLWNWLNHSHKRTTGEYSSCYFMKFWQLSIMRLRLHLKYPDSCS